MTDPDRSHAASYAARTSSPPEPDCDCPPHWKHEPTCVVVTGANPFCRDAKACAGRSSCPFDPACGN